MKNQVIDLQAVMDEIERPLPSEQTMIAESRAFFERKAIPFKIQNFMICKDTDITIFLTQLLYWNARSKVYKDGKYWVVKSKEQWERETGLTRKRIDKAEKKLTDLGILNKENKKFYNDKMGHYQVNMEKYIELENKALLDLWITIKE